MSYPPRVPGALRVGPIDTRAVHLR